MEMHKNLNVGDNREWRMVRGYREVVDMSGCYTKYTNVKMQKKICQKYKLRRKPHVTQ